jgi:hypothetical protein
MNWEGLKRTRRRVEEVPVLRVADLRRAGLLAGGTRAGTLTVYGRPVDAFCSLASVSLRLAGTRTPIGAAAVVWRPSAGACAGGTIPSFLCSGCQRRTMALHILPNALRCWRCARLIHTTRSVSEVDRALLAARKADSKLVAGPRRRWDTTVGRLVAQYVDREQVAEQLISARLQALSRRWPGLADELLMR